MSGLVVESHQYVVNLERISTPKEQLLMFRTGPVDKDVLGRAKKLRFDHAPVVDASGKLRGVVPVARVEELRDAGRSLEPTDPTLYLHELNDRMLVLPFLEEIAEHRAVVIRDTDNEHDPEWFALVTISDLNRHPFRSHLYPMIAELEANLAQLVDAAFPDPSTWILKTTEERQVYHFGQWRVAETKGVDTSPVISCTLMDLINVVAKTETLWEALEYRGRKIFEKSTSPLRDLRNQIMHPVRPLILSQEDVSDLHGKLSTVLDLTSRVNILNERLAHDGTALMRHMPKCI
jgi:hypothetical protein